MLRILMAAGLLLAATTASVSAQAPGQAPGGGPPPSQHVTGPVTTPSDHPPAPRLVCNAGPQTCSGPAHGRPGDSCSCRSQGHRLPGHLVPQPGPRH